MRIQLQIIFWGFDIKSGALIVLYRSNHKTDYPKYRVAEIDKYAVRSLLKVTGYICGYDNQCVQAWVSCPDGRPRRRNFLYSTFVSGFGTDKMIFDLMMQYIFTINGII